VFESFRELLEASGLKPRAAALFLAFTLLTDRHAVRAKTVALVKAACFSRRLTLVAFFPP
jgi:hypothetical protein